jgi:hypothetical protein
MLSIHRINWYFIALSLASTLGATTVPSMSFEELVDQSDLVVSGQVTRAWSDWDAEHKYIWTHYEIAVSDTAKGASALTVMVSEPGGVVGDRGFLVAGSVTYAVGENVAVFARKVPNGYLRTTGWSQGKYQIDGSGRLHATAQSEIVPNLQATGTSLHTLNGITLQTLRSRVATRASIGSRGSAK